MRYKAIIEYDGTAFIGWQKQKYASGHRSVQESIEEAIKAFSRQAVDVYAAGRTDAGVHALGQVIHFDLPINKEEYVIKNALNHYLRRDMIAVLEIQKVDSEFHARFSAKARHYLYKISNRCAPLCINHMRMWHVHKKLDVECMRDAAARIVGKKDFASFRAKSCQSKSSIKTVDSLEIVEEEGDAIHIYISAPSFLHKQVRIIVGTLVLCGSHSFAPSYIGDILEKKDRSAAGCTAPPYGLYLRRVDY